MLIGRISLPFRPTYNKGKSAVNGDEHSDLEKDHPSGNDHKSGTDSTDQPTLSVPPVRHRERTPASAVSRIQPGSRFGPYRIVRTLGRGGMGEVYEAEQVESGHRVALKVLRQSLVSPTDRKRFLREGRLAASVNHPHSVYVYGTDVIDNVPVISMELMPGGTLADRVAKRFGVTADVVHGEVRIEREGGRNA
ncbi:MAG: protein kinase [Planctomycetes bacterium]|nr:protein kinase [Planctomycetota bacterium]